MTTGIFIVSYPPDLEFLDYCLKSIQKFCTGFNEVVVHFPVSAHAVNRQGKIARFVMENRSVDKPFNHHQAIKCNAEKYMDSDFILHVDSDCMFLKPTTPEDYFVDGKPVLMAHPFDHLKDFAPQRYHWRECVQNALGFDPVVETMCRHPAVHYRGLYPQLRSFMAELHKVPFNDYVLAQKEAQNILGFTEFPTLGAFAWKFRHDDYHWIDPTKEPWPDEHVHQYWNRRGLTPELRSEFEKTLT